MKIIENGFKLAVVLIFNEEMSWSMVEVLEFVSKIVGYGVGFGVIFRVVQTKRHLQLTSATAVVGEDAYEAKMRRDLVMLKKEASDFYERLGAPRLP